MCIPGFREFWFVVPHRNPPEVCDLRFDVPYTVLASHDVIYDVFCIIVNVALNNTKFGDMVYYPPQRSQNKLCIDWGDNVDIMDVLWQLYGSILSKIGFFLDFKLSYIRK